LKGDGGGGGVDGLKRTRPVRGQPVQTGVRYALPPTWPRGRVRGSESEPAAAGLGASVGRWEKAGSKAGVGVGGRLALGCGRLSGGGKWLGTEIGQAAD
jgi:hypothetical protein